MHNLKAEWFRWTDNLGEIYYTVLYKFSQEMHDLVSWPDEFSCQGEVATIIFRRDHGISVSSGRISYRAEFPSYDGNFFIDIIIDDVLARSRNLHRPEP